MDWIEILAPAKLNLLLDITGTAPDGYHTVEMVMQSVDLCDTLTVKLSGGGIRVACSDSALPRDEDNLAGKAAAAFLQATGHSRLGIEIWIEKRIPWQAGLGGGSSDAAAVIRALNRLLGTRLSDARLAEIGARVGMDVVFCLFGGTMLAEGRGEVLSPLPPLPDCHLLIVKPPGGTSTAEAYRRYDSCPGQIAHPNLAGMKAALAAADLAGVAAHMSNVFEQLLPCPARAALCAELLAGGALGALMSGSGSAIFGLFEERSAAEACLRKMSGGGEQLFLARPVGRFADARQN